MLLMLVLVGLMFVGLSAVEEPIGVVVNSETFCIQFIDPISMSISEPLLRHELGSIGSGLFDVVITSDGKKAIVSNFNEATIHFIDISGGFDSVPIAKGRGHLGIFAEDMALSPDNKYVLVTDGNFTPWIYVFDVATHKLVNQFHMRNSRAAQSVDMTSDGKHVIVADYFGGYIHSYDFDSETGALTYRQSRSVLPAWPMNTVSSPDGRTVLVMSRDSGGILPVFYIDSNGDLCDKGGVKVPTKNFQSAVFSKNGKKAYAISNNLNGTYILEFDILAPGKVTFNRSKKMGSPRGTGQLFGVDTIALDPSDSYLFVSNPTINDGKAHLTVLDVNTLESVTTLPTYSVSTGITFGTIKH